MGGVLIIGTVVISGVLWARPDNRFVCRLFSMVYLAGLFRGRLLESRQKDWAA
jgi:hypothetical protein